MSRKPKVPTPLPPFDKEVEIRGFLFSRALTQTTCVVPAANILKPGSGKTTRIRIIGNLGADDAGQGVTGEARRARRSGGTGICQKKKKKTQRQAHAEPLHSSSAKGPKWERLCRREEDREPREPRPPLPRSSGRAPPTAIPGPLRRSNLCPQNLLPGRPPPDLSAPVTSRRQQPAVPAQLSASLGPPRAPRPRSLPGVPFPERGFEQRRDVRTLGVQVRRSAFRHLLPLAVAEAAATAAAARPGALWEWRPRPRPAGGSVPNGTRGRGSGGRGSAGSAGCARLRSAAPSGPRAPRSPAWSPPPQTSKFARFSPGSGAFSPCLCPGRTLPCPAGPALAATASKPIFAGSLLLDGGRGRLGHGRKRAVP